MRPAGRGMLESLYFNYPRFRFRRPPELSGENAEHPVVVVGAGPVGLTAAIALARYNVACVVLERKDTLNDGSRAICISRNSLQLLQQLGAARQFESKGLGWTHGRCFYRDKQIYRLEMPHSAQERFFPMYNLQQQYIEQFLVEKAAEFPELIDLRWQSEANGVRRRGSGMELTVRTPEGDYDLRCRYVLAADGARSRVREALGLRLKGENLPGHYVIADVRMDHDFPTERRCFFESAANPEATILIHRQPDDIWRIDWQLPEGQEPAEATGEQAVRARVQAILDMIGHTGAWELEWWSIYTANTLCLDDYRHGSVLFAGDAAHIVPIFGVRGLNNGIEDAFNAGWKLAYAINGDGDESLLDTYSLERRRATLDVFRNAGKSSRFMRPPTRGYRLMRKAVLQLSLRQEFTRRFADPRQVQPYTYRDSPLTTYANRDGEFGGGIQAGHVAVSRKIADDEYLLEHLARISHGFASKIQQAGARTIGEKCGPTPGFTGLYFTRRTAIPKSVLELLARLAAIDRYFRSLVIAANRLRAPGVPVLEDRDEGIFAAYAAIDGTFYLLRPDLHVAARWLSAEPGEIELALLTALARSR